MFKYIIALLLLSTPCYAGSAILDVSGYNNVMSFTQLGNSNLNFTANNSTNNNNTYTVVQSGGNHYLDFDLNGEFKDYEISIFQVSPLDQSLSVSQTCTLSSCSPEPFSVYQY